MALYIVATPIGNLKDITLRALEVLKSVDAIASEDTRVTKKLLSRYDIQKPCIAYHEHSRSHDIDRIINYLRAGKDIAYVVDAGTPGISDPGGYLIKCVREKVPEVAIVPIPGPSALLAAVSIAGLARGEFLFLGFPPHKKGRQTFFASIARQEYPIVLYESPHRLLKTLIDIKNAGLGERDAVIAKELTKIFEQVWQGTIESHISFFKKEKKIRGEYVIVINR